MCHQERRGIGGEREEKEKEKREREMREACWSPKMLNPSDPGAVACWKWVFWRFFSDLCVISWL